MAVIPSNFPAPEAPYFTHPHFIVTGACSDFVSNFGLKYDSAIYIEKSLYTAGSTVTFTWNGNTVILTIEAVLSNDHYGSFLDDNAETFHIGAAANTLLNADFDFFFNFDDPFFAVVSIYAKREGYDLTIASSSSAISVLAETLSEPVILNNNITALMDVYKSNGSYNYDLKGTLKSSLVFQGDIIDQQFMFDVSEFFHRCLSFENIEYHDFSNIGLITLADKSCGMFKLSLRQSSEWPGVENIGWYTILRGGLTKRDYILMQNDYFGNYPDALIWRLLNYVTDYTDLFVKVCKNQKLFSSFFVRYPIDSYDVEYEIYIDITDVLGATGSYELLKTIIMPQNKYTLQYSYNDLDIGGIAAGLSLGAVKNWQIRALNTVTTDEYTLDFRELVPNDYREVFFVYESSKSGFQTIRTLGQHEYGVEIDKAEFEKTIPLIEKVNEDFMVTETYGHIFKGDIFSGWLNRTDIFNFLDFLNSENVWKQDDRHEAMIPVKILKGSWTLETKSNNGVHQYGFNLQYVETARDKYVTDLIPY